jgi:ABC-type transport system involved in cytochrome c biogenesis permease component
MRILAGQIALETKLFLRRKDELFWNLAFPMFFMVLYGFIYSNTMWGEIKAIDYMFPGIIVMALMVNGIMVSATVFVEERGKGITAGFP